MTNEPKIRAEALLGSSNKQYWVNVWVDKTNVYSMGLFSGSGDAMMTKAEAELICSKLNAPDPIEVIEEMERDLSLPHHKENSSYRYCPMTLSELRRRMDKIR